MSLGERARGESARGVGARGTQARPAPEAAAPARGGGLDARGILHLQRTLGNRAVGRILAGVAPPPGLQRTLKLTGTGEVFGPDDAMKFLTKYWQSVPGGAIGEAVSGMIKDSGEHEYDSVEAMVKALSESSAKEEEVVVKEEAPTLTVWGVTGELGGNLPDLKEGSKLVVKPSKNQGSRPMFDVELSSRRYVLKQERSDRSEFMGMEAMDKQGIRVPSTLLLFMDDGKEYILMEYVEGLGTGMGGVNSAPDERLEAMGEQLGRVHVTDVRILNVDRLPWRGNNRQGHLFNVFTDLIGYNVLGMDSEKQVEESESMQKDREAELKEIDSDPEGYAGRMMSRISEAGKDKLMLDEKRLPVFTRGFAAGLAAALSSE